MAENDATFSPVDENMSDVSIGCITRLESYWRADCIKDELLKNAKVYERLGDLCFEPTWRHDTVLHDPDEKGYSFASLDKISNVVERRSWLHHQTIHDQPLSQPSTIFDLLRNPEFQPNPAIPLAQTCIHEITFTARMIITDYRYFSEEEFGFSTFSEQETIELQFDAFGHLIDTEDTHIRFDANGKIQYDFMEWVLQFLVSQRESKLSTHSNGRRNTD